MGIMSVASLIFILAEVGLALDWPISPLISWSLIGAFGAGTVLSYTINARRFPKESLGRANSALNLFHFAAAFGVQSLVGHVIALWPRDDLGHYPPEAYKAAFLGLAVSQLVALLWFLRPVNRNLQNTAVARISNRNATTRWARLRTVVSITLAMMLGAVVYSNWDRLVVPALAALRSGFWDNSAVKRLTDRLWAEKAFEPSPALNRWLRQRDQRPMGKTID